MDAAKMLLALQAGNTNLTGDFESLREENRLVLQAAGADLHVQAFFAQFSYNSELMAGQFCFMQANCLKKSHDWEDDFKRALQVKLLLVGSGPNGDLVTLDLLDNQAGILFHDYFEENPSDNPRKYLIKMNCSLGQFYWNSAFVEGYPLDAYEAAAFTGATFTGYSDL